MAQRHALKAYEKQKLALQLALAGEEYQSIADKVGYNSRQAAWKAVKSALNKTVTEDAEQVKLMQMRRLDRMLKALWPEVLQGNVKAILAAIRVEERRAKLLGLDGPIKLQHDLGDEVAEGVQRFHELLDRLIRARRALGAEGGVSPGGAAPDGPGAGGLPLEDLGAA